MGILDFFKQHERDSGPKTAIVRKKETEMLLKSLDIPFNEHLPIIDEESEAKIRTPEEIAERILILTYLNYVSEVPEGKEEVIEFLKINSLWDKVSANEKELFQKQILSQQETINISWRSEAVWLLLWTIRHVDRLELPTEQISIDIILSKLPEFLDNPKDFIEAATLRPTSEILDISDLIYRLHWAARNADINNQTIPANLILSVIMEWHYAINWVTYSGDEWDDISTDT